MYKLYLKHETVSLFVFLMVRFHSCGMQNGPSTKTQFYTNVFPFFLINSFCFFFFSNAAPPNPEGFISTKQNGTSITLQWNKVNNVSYVLQFYSVWIDVPAWIDVAAPDGDGPITHTVSSLTAGTTYTFTLYTVFRSIRSSGVNIIAFTGKILDFIKVFFLCIWFSFRHDN